MGKEEACAKWGHQMHPMQQEFKRNKKSPVQLLGRTGDCAKQMTNQNENVFVTNHSRTGAMRTEAQVLPSGWIEIGMSC